MDETWQGEVTVGGRYKLVARAADRGAGQSWRAVDARREGVTVTVKSMCAVDGDAPPAALLAVIRARKALRAEAVPTLLAHGVHGGRAWVAFDDVQGASVGAMLDAARLEGEQIPLATARQVLDAVLAAARDALAAPLPVSAGVITPGGVIVAEGRGGKRVVRVVDFGLHAWLDAPDDAPPRSARTLVTLAPELPSGPITARSDVFALAAWATELLALPPDLGATMGAVVDARRRPDVPAAVWAALSSAMSPSPEKRPEDVAALSRALDAAWAVRTSALQSRIVAPAPASSGSLLETVAPDGPSLGVVRDAARAAVQAAPSTPVLQLPALPDAPAPARQATPLSARVTQPQPADDENPWSTNVLQRVPSDLHAEENPWSTGVLQRVPDELIAQRPAPIAADEAPWRAPGPSLDQTVSEWSPGSGFARDPVAPAPEAVDDDLMETVVAEAAPRQRAATRPTHSTPLPRNVPEETLAIEAYDVPPRPAQPVAPPQRGYDTREVSSPPSQGMPRWVPAVLVVAVLTAMVLGFFWGRS